MIFSVGGVAEMQGKENKAVKTLVPLSHARVFESLLKVTNIFLIVLNLSGSIMVKME